MRYTKITHSAPFEIYNVSLAGLYAILPAGAGLGAEGRRGVARFVVTATTSKALSLNTRVPELITSYVQKSPKFSVATINERRYPNQ